MYQNLLYSTTEHAYQAAKVHSPFVRAMIRDCETPGKAKSYLENHQITPDHDWTVEKKLKVMEELLHIKFGGKDPLLTRALMGTGEDAMLIEGNTWGDTFWGVCKDVGENHLGRLLMKVRSELFARKAGVEDLLSKTYGNKKIAETMRITQRELYEKMVAFRISNKQYWIS